MDLSKRLRQLKARANKPTTERVRPRLRKNRRLLMESLDQRRLLAGDVATAELPPTPVAHVLQAPPIFASGIDGIQHDHSGHQHDGHDHGCTCGACMQLLHQGKAGSGEVNFAASSANGKWSQPGGLGSSVTVTYSYAGLLDGGLNGNLTTDQLRASVEEALGLWASYAPLNFVEVEDAGPPIYVNGQDNTTYRSTGTPDIRIGHHDIDGANGTLAYAYFPDVNFWGASGDVHMDSDESWTLGGNSGTDFLEVMTHELGHALGLDHEDNSIAIMNPFHAGVYDGLGTGFLYSHDIDAIRSVYGTGTGSVTPIIYNDPPQVTAIADQNLSFDSTGLTVSVQATDPDNDVLTYTATASQVDPLEQEAYDLKVQYGLRPAQSEFFNARGQGEKYFYGQGSNWFFMLPDGAVHQWNGSIAGSPQIGQLDSTYHDQLSLLTLANEPSQSPVEVNLDWSNNDLTITTTSSTPSFFVVSVVVADQYESTTETFNVQIVDNVPVISDIPDQVVSIQDGFTTVTVDASDPEGETLTLTATASQVDPMSVAAYELQQQYGFRGASTEAFNFRGQGEKYFYGSGAQWFFILPSGSIHRWGGSISGSPQVGQLDATYHADLNLLYQASQPSTAQAPPVDLTWSGNQLTIDWPDDFVGSFVVTATAQDQHNTVSTEFNVEIANSAPTLDAIADQNVSVSQSSVTVPVSVSDGDGDAIQLSATATQIDPAAVVAYNLRTELSLRSAGRDYHNARGFGEKYFTGSGGWYFILPGGEVHRWAGSINGSPLVGEVDPSYHENLSSLLNAQEPTETPINATLTWSGHDLQIGIPNQYAGTFVVTVTATDGFEAVETDFSVNVVNQAPTVSAIADQQFATGQNTLAVDVLANDLDGDTLTYSATASSIDPLQQLAYELRTQNGFVSAGSDYFNSRGYQGRYFLGSSGWHFILPDGGVYRWTGTVPGSTLIGQLDSSYHANLSSLLNATQPTSGTPDVQLNFSGNQLTIVKPADFTDSFTVTVSVTDGAETVTQSFNVSASPSNSQAASSRAASTLDSMSLAVDQIMSQLASNR